MTLHSSLIKATAVTAEKTDHGKSEEDDKTALADTDHTVAFNICCKILIHLFTSNEHDCTSSQRQ